MIFTVFSNAFILGSQLGWTAPTLVKLKDADDFAASDAELSWIASSYEIGRFFGPLLTAIFIDKIGRKNILTICSFSFFISWIIMVFVHSAAFICCLRMLQGTTHSMNLIGSIIYLAENCTPKMRGIMSSIILVCIKIAIVIENTLTTYLSFATVAMVNAAVGLCGLSTNLFLTETPYYLVMKGCNEVAKKNLMWLRGTSIFDIEVKSELDKIMENVELERLKKKSTVSVLVVPENYKSLFIVIIPSLLVPMAGSFAILAYSSMIFQSSSMFSSREYTIIMGIFPLITSVILSFIIETYNRRRLSICSSFLLAMIHACVFSLISAKVHITDDYFSWLIFLLTTTARTVSDVMFLISYIISGELLPMSVKAIGSCVGMLMNSLAASITVAVFLPIAGTYGMEYNFLLYSIVSVLLFVFVSIALPETKGKSLFDLQKSLQAKGNETH